MNSSNVKQINIRFTLTRVVVNMTTPVRGSKELYNGPIEEGLPSFLNGLLNYSKINIVNERDELALI